MKYAVPGQLPNLIPLPHFRNTELVVVRVESLREIDLLVAQFLYGYKWYKIPIDPPYLLKSMPPYTPNYQELNIDRWDIENFLKQIRGQWLDIDIPHVTVLYKHFVQTLQQVALKYHVCIIMDPPNPEESEQQIYVQIGDLKRVNLSPLPLAFYAAALQLAGIEIVLEVP